MKRVLFLCVAMLLVGGMAASALGQLLPASIYEFKVPLALDPARTLVGLKVQDSQPWVNNRRRGLGVFAATAVGPAGPVQLDISSGFTVDVIVGPKEMAAQYEYNGQYNPYPLPKTQLWDLQGLTTGHWREPLALRNVHFNLCFIGNSTEAGFGEPFTIPSNWWGPEYHGGNDGFPEDGVVSGGDRTYHVASTMGNATLPGDWTEVAEPGGLAEGEGMEARFNCMASMTSHWIAVFQIVTAECLLPAAQQGAYDNVNFALVASSGTCKASYIRIYAVYEDGEEVLHAFADYDPNAVPPVVLDGPTAPENDGGEDFDVLYTTTHVAGGVSIGPPTRAPVAVPGGPYVAEATSLEGAYVQLDGSGSYDWEPPSEPDAVIVAWEWDLNIYQDSDGDGDPRNDVDATGPTPVCLFPLGVTWIILRVQDKDDGLWSPWVWISVTSVTVTPQPAIPPVAVANGPYVALATSWAGACVLLDGSASYDPDDLENPDAIVAYEWDLDVAADSDGDGDPANDADCSEPMPAWGFPIGQTEIALRVKDNDQGWWSEADVTTVTVSEIEVEVDIKPGSDTNSINMGSHGVVPVAFLGSEDFAAGLIDPTTVTLRGEEFTDGLVKLRGKKDPTAMASLEDVNGDGHLDLVVHLETERLAEYELTTLCDLGALTYDGYVVSGSDMIHVVPQE